jgi:hypothetical protein
MILFIKPIESKESSLQPIGILYKKVLTLVSTKTILGIFALAASFDAIKELIAFDIKIPRGHVNLVITHLL